MQDAAPFLSELEQQVSPLETEFGEVVWQFRRTGDLSLQPKLVELSMREHEIFSNREKFGRVRDWRQAGGHDADTGRIVEILYYTYLVNQEPAELARRKAELDAEIGGRYSNFRGKVDGNEVSSNDIRAILKESDDNELRRKAWEASKQIGPEVRDLLLELVAKRNEGAQGLSFRDYYAMNLERQEIDEDELYSLLDKLEEQTGESFTRAKAELDARLVERFSLSSPEELYPWHYADPFFQEAPALTDLDLNPYFLDRDIERLTKKTFKRLGLDILPTLQQSDLYERKGKDQHAFCLRIGRDSSRVHVLCNIRSDEQWMGTMLHEFGHAIYDQYLRPEQTYFLREVAHTNSTEAIAMLFGRLTHSAAWLTDVLGLRESKAEELAADAHRQLSFQMMVFTRWMMVMTHFERALYAEPSRDLDTLWWDLAERYQRIKRQPQRRMPDWATKMHIAEAPVYYHNYMLGEMTASQIQHHIEHTLGQVPLVRQRAAGPWLVEKLFKQGALRPWNEALAFLTGEKLDPRYFISQFVS